MEPHFAAIRVHWPVVREQAAPNPTGRTVLGRHRPLGPFIFEDAPKRLSQFDTNDSMLSAVTVRQDRNQREGVGGS